MILSLLVDPTRILLMLWHVCRSHKQTFLSWPFFLTIFALFQRSWHSLSLFATAYLYLLSLFFKIFYIYVFFQPVLHI